MQPQYKYDVGQAEGGIWQLEWMSCYTPTRRPFYARSVGRRTRNRSFATTGLTSSRKSHETSPTSPTQDEGKGSGGKMGSFCRHR
jgi:hypothetical protein